MTKRGADSKSQLVPTELQAPSLALLLREATVPFEYARFVLRPNKTLKMPRGDGHPVILIPGFGATPFLMRHLKRALRDLGYSAEDWGQGRNIGMRPHIKNALVHLIQRLHDRHAGKVTLIGWSLGGVFAREMARANPQWIRRVITMGSPINGAPDANNMMPLFRLANRGRLPKLDRTGFEKRIVAPPVPCTAIYSKRDGIVAWEACLEEPADNTENVEVHGTHFGLVSNFEVLKVIAERLADSSP